MTARATMTHNIRFAYYRLLIINMLCFVIINVKPMEVPGVGFHGPKGNMTLQDNGFLEINCTKPHTISESVPPLETTEIYFHEVAIIYCAPPKRSYIEELQALNLNTTGIRTLLLVYDDETPLPPGNYTVGLNISTMFVFSYKTKDIFQKAQDFFDPLNKLETLFISGARLPRIPETMPLQELTMISESTADNWGGCQHLESLKLQAVNLKRMPEWPKNCTNLRELRLHHMLDTLETLESKMIAAAPHLTYLSFFYNYIAEFPVNFLKNAQRLQNLDLSNNYFDDKLTSEFPVMNALQTLDASITPLAGDFFDRALRILPSLRQIYMNDNPNFMICPSKETLQQSHVQEIQFKITAVPIECFTKTKFKNLTLLDISSTPTQDFRLLDLPTTDAENLTVQLNKHFELIYFNSEDYQELREVNVTLHKGIHHNQLTVVTTFIDCDCKHGWLARALRDFPNLILMPDLRCNHEKGVNIISENPAKMECNKTVDENSTCTFRQGWESEEVDAECKTAIVPNIEHLRGLNVAGNNLTTFFSYLPSTVTWIDYRNNLLSSADQQAVDTMFLNGRKVWLGGNQIICECHNWILLEAIQQHSDQVEDYEELTCTGSGRLIKEESIAELCQTTIKIALSTLGVFVGLMLILALIARQFREEISLFLYSRGWCLSCLLKEDIDDKPYDAFISFAHGDDSFIQEVLVPGLENSQEKFRLCVHYRDWAFGGWIPVQIMHSVTHSKRTIIVLSKNFIQSKWSALEFRYALTKTSDNNSPRVVVLILDDVLEVGSLNPELKAYLAYNTYLRCDDPWFWQKLRYAMPHRGNKEIRPEQNKRDPDVVQRDLQEALDMMTVQNGRSS